MPTKNELLQKVDDFEKQIFDLKQLIEISKGLNSSLSHNTLIESILFACMGQMQLLEAAIFLKKTIIQDDYILIRNYQGFGIEHNHEYSISSNSKLINFLEQENKCFTLEELTNKFKKDKAIKTLKLIAPTLIVPLIGKGKLNGIIILGKRINSNTFTNDEKNYLMDIASLAGIAIHNTNLYEMTTTDMMTQLKIHQFFQFALMEEREKAKKNKESFILVMIDIDHFKRFNDTYGHTFGDIVLKKVAEILRENVRYNDTVARYGGEEFAIILPNTKIEESIVLTERVRTMVEKTKFSYNNRAKGVSVTISIGLTKFNSKIDTNNEKFIDRADKALYMSKMNGRNMVSWI